MWRIAFTVSHLACWVFTAFLPAERGPSSARSVQSSLKRIYAIVLVRRSKADTSAHCSVLTLSLSLFYFTPPVGWEEIGGTANLLRGRGRDLKRI